MNLNRQKQSHLWLGKMIASPRDKILLNSFWLIRTYYKMQISFFGVKDVWDSTASIGLAVKFKM